MYCCLIARLVQLVPSDWLDVNEIENLEEYAELLLKTNPNGKGGVTTSMTMTMPKKSWFGWTRELNVRL